MSFASNGNRGFSFEAVSQPRTGDTAPNAASSGKRGGIRGSALHGAWTLSLIAPGGTSVCLSIDAPAETDGFTRAEAEAALARMKGGDRICMDGVDEVALDALERMPRALAAVVTDIWCSRKLGYPTATLIESIAHCLLLARAAALRA